MVSVVEGWVGIASAGSVGAGVGAQRVRQGNGARGAKGALGRLSQVGLRLDAGELGRLDQAVEQGGDLDAAQRARAVATQRRRSGRVLDAAQPPLLNSRGTQAIVPTGVNERLRFEQAPVDIAGHPQSRLAYGRPRSRRRAIDAHNDAQRGSLDDRRPLRVTAEEHA